MKARKKAKLVYGAGINDAGYPVHVTAIIGGRQKKMWTCPLYRAWAGMLERCYSDKYKSNKPTYAGCSVAPEWLLFSTFRGWMASQDHEGNHLDKDILIPGNKVYGPDTCVFLSSQLNNFMTDRGAARGEWPLGAGWDKKNGKFKARCSNPFTAKQESIGYFADAGSAHEAWRKRKHELACQYADMQTDTRIAEALRSRYAPSKQRLSSSVDANPKRGL